MAKYIPDSYLYRAIGADINGSCGRCQQSRSDCMCQSLSRMDMCGIIENAAEVDVRENRHGEWDDVSVSFYRKCSECGCCVEWDKRPFLFGDGEYNFCPNCGADMRGEK